MMYPTTCICIVITWQFAARHISYSARNFNSVNLSRSVTGAQCTATFTLGECRWFCAFETIDMAIDVNQKFVDPRTRYETRTFRRNLPIQNIGSWTNSSTHGHSSHCACRYMSPTCVQRSIRACCDWCCCFTVIVGVTCIFSLFARLTLLCWIYYQGWVWPFFELCLIFGFVYFFFSVCDYIYLLTVYIHVESTWS